MAFGNALAFPFHRSKLAAAVAWTPANLFLDGEAGGWYDPTYAMSEDDYPLWQTVIATDRADEAADPVGLYLSNPRDGRGIVNLQTSSARLIGTGWSADPGITVSQSGDYAAVVEVDGSSANKSLFSSGGALQGVAASTTVTAYAVVSKGVLSNAPDIVQLTFRGAGFAPSPYANYNIVTGEVTSTGNGATASIYTPDTIPPQLNDGINLAPGEVLAVLTGVTTTAPGANSGMILCPCNNNPTAGRLPTYSGNGQADFRARIAQITVGSTPLQYQENGVYRGGPGEHFGQATSAARPTLRLVGSLYMLEFDGGDYLTLDKPTLSDGCSLFADPSQKWVVSGVFQFVPGEGSTNRTLVAKAVSTEASRTFHSFVSETAIGATVRGTVNSFTRDFSDGNMHWYLFYWDGTKLWLYVDDDSPLELTVGTAAVNTDEPILLGARTIASPTTFFTGYQQLLVLRSGEISTDEISQLRQWAKTKYGVA